MATVLEFHRTSFDRDIVISLYPIPNGRSMVSIPHTAVVEAAAAAILSREAETLS